VNHLPTVAIVGRPNVGKSSLFNRLIRRRVAIVHDQPGVTRDRLVAECRSGNRPFTIVDTGGIGSEIGDRFDHQVQAEASLAMEMADVILLVVDGQSGINPVDDSVARQLRQKRKSIILVVNKVDHTKHEGVESDFTRLGFEAPIPVSAEHGRGITDLLERIETLLPTTDQLEAATAPSPSSNQPLKLAIVGRPNVGKSSLINAILKDQRTIVSHIAGTTRDAVDIPYQRDGRTFVLIDTAGIRSRKKHDTSVEVFSVMRSEKSIKRADICALVIDASAGITAQDKKIAGLIQEAQRPCLLVVNKLDLIKPQHHLKEFLNETLTRLRRDLFFLSYAPIDLISAQTGENLDRLFKSIAKVEKHSQKRITTGELNRLLQAALELHPPPVQGSRQLKLMYATEVTKHATVQVPTFLLFVNKNDLIPQSYERYLEGKIREASGYYGLPIIFKLRERNESRRKM
jgi:GTPase